MTKDEALDLALDALKNVAVTGPDDDGLVWINLPGNGTTGKAILRVGKAGLIAAQCAKLYEEQRTKAITALTAIKQSRSAPVQEPVAWRYDLAKYRENDLRGRQWAHSVFSPTKPYIDEMVRNLTPLYTTPPAAQPAPVQGPVAWEQYAIKFAKGKKLTYEKPKNLPSYIGVRALVYADTTPPAAPVPLTDEQKQHIHNLTGAGHGLISLVESYINEAAHGITKGQQ